MTPPFGRIFLGVLGAQALSAILALLVTSSGVLAAILAPGVSLDVALVFLQALLEPTLQAALLIAGPVGVTSALWLQPGVASRALWSSAHSAALGCQFLLAVAFVGFVGSFQPQSAARTAEDLITLSRQQCARVTQPTSVSVPVIGLVWLCTPGKPPRLVGGPPTAHRTVWFSADHVWSSKDGTQIDARGVRLAYLGLPSETEVAVQVGRVSVTHFGALSQPQPDRSYAWATAVAACALANAALLGVLVPIMGFGRLASQVLSWLSGSGAALLFHLPLAGSRQSVGAALALFLSLGFTLAVSLALRLFARLRQLSGGRVDRAHG